MSAVTAPTPPPSESIKSPAREIASIAVPVSLEMVIQLVLSFINQIIVGSLGAVAVAAVGLSGSLGFLFFVTLGALGSGTSILVARRHGAADRPGVNQTLTFSVLTSLLLAGLLTTPVVLLAGPLLSLAGGEDAVTRTATPYMQVSMLALIPGSLAWILSGALRSLGHARTPLVATVITVIVESLLAYGLVFGVGPLPQLGVVGAAWALVFANLLKTALLAYQIYGPRHLAALTLPARSAWRAIAAPLLTISAPIAFTEFAWSLGGFLYAAVYARVGTAALAASQIVGTLEGIFIVGSFGLMSAATVFIGRALGAGDAAAAQLWLARISRAGLVTGLGFGALFALSALIVPPLFPRVGTDVHQIALIGILISAAFQIVKVRNMIIGGGVLPGAADGKGVIIGDVVGAFVVGLPLAIGLGLYSPLGVWGVFLARGAEEVVKVSIFEWRRRRINWEKLARDQQGQDVAAH
ncbi:MATE family efflux transporter [Deinococcus radiotolerans]|uniref:Multidrug-efflux transporter n=1 Tax=Deinococcus radiotolerans TaxID=1309407 RepID=A0ABQ2FFU5_9DEIO|nr:MATE family efflux transporter [Deinococcus radiotolerans]GGK91679.1 MATE family efflux transporter [Deinococcus radiotolerans]